MSNVPPILSVCNVSPVDGLVWNEEAAGSNPATQTNSSARRIVENTQSYEVWNGGSIPSGHTNQWGQQWAAGNPCKILD